MSAEAVPAEPEARAEYAGVLRFYHLAKHQEWQVDDVPWGEISFVPEGKGTPERQARRLLTHAFAVEVTDRLKLAAVREEVGAVLEAWLPVGGPEARP